MIQIAPGELQFWRIANIGADLYYRLVLEGHTFWEIARDGNRHNKLVEMDEILLPPASRSEVLVRGGVVGEKKLRTLAFNTGPDGDSYDEADLATVVRECRPVAAIPLPQPSRPSKTIALCRLRTGERLPSTKIPTPTSSMWIRVRDRWSSMRIVWTRPSPWARSRNGRSTMPPRNCMSSTFIRPTSR